MAVDTRSKRASAVHMGMPWETNWILPDNTLDQGDRQHASHWYSGILAGLAAAAAVSAIFPQLRRGAGMHGGGMRP